MSAMESFLLGIMVAWTPSLAVMGWFLWGSARDLSKGKSDAFDY